MPYTTPSPTHRIPKIHRFEAARAGVPLVTHRPAPRDIHRASTLSIGHRMSPVPAPTPRPPWLPPGLATHLPSEVARPSAPSVSLVPVSSVHRNEIVISVDLELELAHALLEALDLTEQRRLISK